MNAEQETAFHRGRLAAHMARARTSIEAQAAHAEAAAASMPQSDPDDPEMKLYHLGGKLAYNFCLCFAFIAPILLFLASWD